MNLLKNYILFATISFFFTGYVSGAEIPDHVIESVVKKLAREGKELVVEKSFEISGEGANALGIIMGMISDRKVAIKLLEKEDFEYEKYIFDSVDYKSVTGFMKGLIDKGYKIPNPALILSAYSVDHEIKPPWQLSSDHSYKSGKVIKNFGIIVQEYAQGESSDWVIDLVKNDEISHEESMEIFYSIGYQYGLLFNLSISLKNNVIVHPDATPQNIFVTKDKGYQVFWLDIADIRWQSVSEFSPKIFMSPHPHFMGQICPRKSTISPLLEKNAKKETIEKFILKYRFCNSFFSGLFAGLNEDIKGVVSDNVIEFTEKFAHHKENLFEEKHSWVKSPDKIKALWLKKREKNPNFKPNWKPKEYVPEFIKDKYFDEKGYRVLKIEVSIKDLIDYYTGQL